MGHSRLEIFAAQPRAAGPTGCSSCGGKGASHRAWRPASRKTGKVGEATEGKLLALHGRMVGDLFDDSPFGFKLNIDDGSGPIQIFLFPGTGISTGGLRAGVSIDVTCFSNQFEDIFECDPPAADDFAIK